MVPSSNVTLYRLKKRFVVPSMGNVVPSIRIVVPFLTVKKLHVDNSEDTIYGPVIIYHTVQIYQTGYLSVITYPLSIRWRVHDEFKSFVAPV